VKITVDPLIPNIIEIGRIVSEMKHTDEYDLAVLYTKYGKINVSVKQLNKRKSSLSVPCIISVSSVSGCYCCQPRNAISQ
jgi:hypothetical protein